MKEAETGVTLKRKRNSISTRKNAEIVETASSAILPVRKTMKNTSAAAAETITRKRKRKRTKRREIVQPRRTTRENVKVKGNTKEIVLVIENAKSVTIDLLS